MSQTDNKDIVSIIDSIQKESKNDPLRLDDLLVSAKDFCLLHGLLMFDQQNDLTELGVAEGDKDQRKNYKAVHSPIALLPTLYPRHEFEYAMSIQNKFNELIYLISLDYEYLKSAYANVVKLDPFSKSLFNIYETVRSEGVTQVFVKLFLLS
jgi:hypothetical protein